MTNRMHPGHLTYKSAQTLATIDKEKIEHQRQRQQFFTNLLDALWPPSDAKQTPQGTFADCQAIKYSQEFILKSFHVEGVGDLQLPLSAEGASKLRTVCEQAPFGKGLDTVVDTRVRRCWQVDAANVVFPQGFLSDTIQPLAMKAVRALGLDGAGVQLEAHFYKLLFYEAGGHFKFHRDTEKEKGMFATMILQLPTEEGYTGGRIVVEHFEEKKEFDCHVVSALGFCYTVFFADCLHALQEIKSGTRLCLAFNLVKGNAFSDPVHEQFIASKVRKAEAALEPWWEEATERKSRVLGEKLAIPLRHEYTKENFSFAGLKGDDNIVAEVLKECRDKNKEKWLELYLCLVTKHTTGTPTSPLRADYYGGPVEEPDHHDMHEIVEEEINFENWIGFDDEPISEAFVGLEIDFEKQVVDYGDDPFDGLPDSEHYEDYMGNYGPTLEHWYHRAMLVVWPKALSISVACEVSVARAFNLLENMATSDPKFLGQLHQVVCYCGRNPAQVWADYNGGLGEDSLTPRLLTLCINSGALEDVLQVFQVLANRSPKYKVGVRNAEVATAIATAVQVFGWESVSSHIMNLVKKCALAQGESCAQLAKALISMGMDIAGALVALTTFGVFEARIAKLVSHKLPEFTWCQPLTRLPGEPAIENFLKGPREKLIVPVHGLPNARLLAENYFQAYSTYKGSGYSATATAGGRGKEAFCEIQKTRRFYEDALEHWRKEQAQIQSLRLQLGNLRSAVPETNAFFNESEQRNKKRQRMDAQDVEATTKRAKDNTIDFIELSL